MCLSAVFYWFERIIEETIRAAKETRRIAHKQRVEIISCIQSSEISTFLFTSRTGQKRFQIRARESISNFSNLPEKDIETKWITSKWKIIEPILSPHLAGKHQGSWALIWARFCPCFSCVDAGKDLPLARKKIYDSLTLVQPHASHLAAPVHLSDLPQKKEPNVALVAWLTDARIVNES